MSKGIPEGQRHGSRLSVIQHVLSLTPWHHFMPREGDRGRLSSIVSPAMIHLAADLDVIAHVSGNDYHKKEPSR